jgi:hypothetical protein
MSGDSGYTLVREIYDQNRYSVPSWAATRASERLG